MPECLIQSMRQAPEQIFFFTIFFIFIAFFALANSFHSKLTTFNAERVWLFAFWLTICWPITDQLLTSY